MAKPSLSVNIPIYNSERFLEECLRSVLAQTFTDFEVIAVLDGCTDRSEEILMDLRDERFRIIKHETNLGVIAGLNEGIRLARAPLLTRMDADDTCDPDRFRKQCEYLAVHPEVDVAGTWYDYIDESGKRVKKAFPFPAEHDEIKHDFRVRDAICGASALCRTEKLREVGGYSLEFPIAEDYVLWLKCLAAGHRFANLTEVLYHYRMHSRQSSKTDLNRMIRLTNLAYQKYGRLIWGQDAPDFELGAPLHRRAIKKLKRLMRGKW